MIVAMLASVVLVMATILILYETLRLTSNHLAELPFRPRARIIVVVLATFVGHTAAVWTYAFAYWMLAVTWRIGGFAGLPVESFQDCLYFSVVTLTTVGFGDFAPTTAGAQIFTIFYILTGIGVFVALLASVAQQYIAQKSEAPSARERLSARRERRQGE